MQPVVLRLPQHQRPSPVYSLYQQVFYGQILVHSPLAKKLNLARLKIIMQIVLQIFSYASNPCQTSLFRPLFPRVELTPQRLQSLPFSHRMQLLKALESYYQDAEALAKAIRSKLKELSLEKALRKAHMQSPSGLHRSPAVHNLSLDASPSSNERLFADEAITQEFHCFPFPLPPDEGDLSSETQEWLSDDSSRSSRSILSQQDLEPISVGEVPIQPDSRDIGSQPLGAYTRREPTSRVHLTLKDLKLSDEPDTLAFDLKYTHPNIESLSISPSKAFYQFTPEKIVRLAKCLPNLKSIQIRNITYGIDHLLLLLTQLPQLEELDLSLWSYLDDLTLQKILRTCPRLRYLILNNCDKLKNFTIIFNLCPHLIELHLEGLTHLDYDQLSFLCRSLKDLRVFNVDYCDQIQKVHRSLLLKLYGRRLTFDSVMPLFPPPSPSKRPSFVPPLKLSATPSNSPCVLAPLLTILPNCR